MKFRKKPLQQKWNVDNMSMDQKAIDLLSLNKDELSLNYSLRDKAEDFVKFLIKTLFDKGTDLESNLPIVESNFKDLVDLASKGTLDAENIWCQYGEQLPELIQKINLDAQAFIDNDPASTTIEEVYVAYPGFLAILIYRLSHPLYVLKVPTLPRLMAEFAHRISGTEINPGAQIGESFFIDHATGTVIGETAIIEDHVRIYQGVTLGALHVAKSLQNTKRHPTVKRNVTIYANATILGGDTVIGENSIIGGNVWLTNSVPANSIVTHTSEIKIRTQS